MNSITFFLVATLATSSAFSTELCDSIAERTLTVGMQTKFFLIYENPDQFKHNISIGQVIINESKTGDLNRNSNPTFSWTQQAADQRYEINPGQSLQLLIANEDYQVIDYPSDQSAKLEIQYILNIQGQNPDETLSKPPRKHVSCIRYSIIK